MNWRRAALSDLDEIAGIAEEVHPDFPESNAVLADKLARFPAGCWLAPGAGYLVSHPWRGAPPKLDALLPDCDAPDHFYIHDLALLPAARGHGLAPAAVRLAEQAALAEGLAQMALVAVSGSAPFWTRYGFVATNAPPGALNSYGADAVYMARALRGSG